jgi:hypothetical protein
MHRGHPNHGKNCISLLRRRDDQQSASLARFSHDGKSSRGYSFTKVSRSQTGQIITGDPEPLPFGTEIIVDFGNLLYGAGSFRPYDMSLLVPHGQPIPVVPEGKIGEYTDMLALFIYLRGRGICQWLIGGVLAQNAVHALWTTFCRAPEAAEGLIPVLTLRPSLATPIASRNGEISYKPVLETTGWTTRDSTFGPRTVPAPQTRLGSDGAAAAIAAPEPVPAALPQPVLVILPPEQAAFVPAAPRQQEPATAAVASPVIAGDAMFETAIPAAAPSAAAAPGPSWRRETAPPATTATTVVTAAPSAKPKF